VTVGLLAALAGASSGSGSARLARAFDDAWAQLQIVETEPAMASLVRTALAKRIIEMAQRPGVDVQKLRDDAVAYVKNNPLWPAP
jgi:hypothetical protein